MLKKKCGKKVQQQFGLVRYQVQKQVLIAGRTLKDSTESFGCKERVEGAQALLRTLVSQEVATHSASKPETKFENKNIAVVTCNNGIEVRFAVVRITIPRR